MRFETLAVHAAAAPDPVTGSVAPPLHLSTTFARTPEGVPVAGYTYIREGNPNQAQLEVALASLEGGQGALVFASGMAAGVALLQSLPRGSRILIPDDVYYGYRVVGLEFLGGWGLTVEEVPMWDTEALRNALAAPAGLVWLETPSNPLMKVTDLRAAADLAHAAGALVLVDGTFATPALQRPLELGADLVLHSATKYMGGHSDVQEGALVFARRDEVFEKVAHARHLLGAVASPFSSWLVLRGLRTLAVRVAAQSATALAVAKALEGHAGVSAVHYPGLASNPGHAVAARQMTGFGAMISFQVAAGREAAIRAVGRTKLFVRATSLGGVESLIEHRATSEGPQSRAPQDLIRLSIGLEHAEDLVADLVQALG